MLILTRKEGESITLGDKISLKIISTSKGIVKLGIEAPKNILILREELSAAVKSKNLESSVRISEDEFENLKKKFSKW